MVTGVYMDKGQERAGWNGEERAGKEWGEEGGEGMQYTYHYIPTDECTSLNCSLVCLKSLPLE